MFNSETSNQHYVSALRRRNKITLTTFWILHSVWEMYHLFKLFSKGSKLPLIPSQFLGNWFRIRCCVGIKSSPCNPFPNLTRVHHQLQTTQLKRTIILHNWPGLCHNAQLAIHHKSILIHQLAVVGWCFCMVPPHHSSLNFSTSYDYVPPTSISAQVTILCSLT